MPDGIEALYRQYQQKYVLYSKAAIIDIMLDDGVINFEQAEKLQKGISIFYEPRSTYYENKNKDFEPIQLFGGFFSRPNLNRKIEPTFQPWAQGDCLLLSDINSLSYTSWGKKVIQDVIVPDVNSSGVTIKFEGSPLEQKNIHLTTKQIQDAKESGNYAMGDDDMIAFELAAEYTFRQMVKQGLAKRVVTDNHIKSKGGKYRSYIFGGVGTDKFKQYPISELLGIKTYAVDFNIIDTQPTVEKDIDKLLMWAAKNKQNISGVCGFNSTFYTDNPSGSTEELRENHAYAIKSITYGKEIVITDPHYSDVDIPVSWEDLFEHVRRINFSFKDDKTLQTFKKEALPPNYEKLSDKYK